MKSKNVLIETSKLKVGLFISALDRPWDDTPVFNHGFWLENELQIQQLQEQCHSVFVDVGRSQAKFVLKKATVPSYQLMDNEQSYDAAVKRDRQQAKNIAGFREYRPLKSRKQEFSNALFVYEQITASLDSALNDVTAGTSTNLKELKNLTSQLVTTIRNNTDTISLLTRMGEPLLSMHNPAIRIAVWSVLFGILAGKNKEVLEGLALAGLLCKIGYAKTQTSAISKDENIPSELNPHINKSLVNLKEQKEIDLLVTHSLTNHLERLDGSGYPRKLKGNRIPFSAQIMGISEYYERLVSPEFATPPLSPAKALSCLQSLRGLKFSENIVDQFTHMLGLYPTGSLVLLNTNEIALVVEQIPKKKLAPTILILTTPSGEAVSTQVQLDWPRLTSTL